MADMWRPKDGFERRFEIQRKEDYERDEREREKERQREGDSYQGTPRLTGGDGDADRPAGRRSSSGVVWPTGVRWRRSRMSSGGAAEEAERGHRGRNSELRRSISDMNLSLRRRQGNHVTNEPRGGGGGGGGGRPGGNDNGASQDRKNIVSMIDPQQGEVRGKLPSRRNESIRSVA